MEYVLMGLIIDIGLGLFLSGFVCFYVVRCVPLMTRHDMAPYGRSGVVLERAKHKTQTITVEKKDHHKVEIVK